MARASYERMGRLIPQAPHLVPIALEALLHLPVCMIYDPAKSNLSAQECQVTTPRCTVESLGIMTPSYLAFTDERYWWSAFQGATPAVPGASGLNIREMMSKLKDDADAKLYVDPGCGHALCVTPAELNGQFEAWQSAPPAQDPFKQGLSGCKFEEATDVCQILLDRLCCFLSGLEEVVQAYVIWAGPQETEQPKRLALLIRCRGWEVLERIRKALPLLNWGLTEAESLHYMLCLAFYRSFADDVAFHLAPVYDRSVAPYLKPEFIQIA